MVREVGGLGLGGPRGKGSQVSQRAQNHPIQLAIAKKQSKRSKKGPFCYILGPPGSHPGNGINGARRGRSLPVPPGFSSHGRYIPTSHMLA